MLFSGIRILTSTGPGFRFDTGFDARAMSDGAVIRGCGMNFDLDDNQTLFKATVERFVVASVNVV